MKQGGGLISLQLKAKDVKAVEAFCDSLKTFLLATSWGGHESLCFPTCALIQSASFKNPLPYNLIRLYIGLEDPGYLKADLEKAFEKI
jgi:cystathionine beta-lyase/cystathionine gamma-synthase